jgi:tetratricopeptide (TPR) repeat protein
MNKVHLNFYKTRIRVFVALSAVDPRYLDLTQKTLIEALKLAPTDAKLWYNLALLNDQLGNKTEALTLYEETIKLKPNYEVARMALGQLYEASDSAKALEQYDYILKYINPQNSTAQEKLEKLN